MGKMKDISIELEEAGLDPSDNSNIQGYVDDTHHFGEDVLKESYPHRFDTELLKLELQGKYVKRYSYSGRLVKCHLHYDVIDCHTREVDNTYQHIKKTKE